MNPIAAEFFDLFQGSFSARVGVETPAILIMVVMNLSATVPQAEGAHALHANLIWSWNPPRRHDR
jgi:hypothetical protein